MFHAIKLEPYELILKKANKLNKPEIKKPIRLIVKKEEKPFYNSRTLRGNLLVISIVCGCMEMLRDHAIRKNKLSKTFDNYILDIKNKGIEIIKAFPVQISDEGYLTAYKKGVEFQKKYFKFATKQVFTSFCIAVCEQLYFEKNKKGYVLNQEIRVKVGELIDKLIRFHKYMDRDLSRYSDYSEASIYARGFYEIIYK